MNITKITKILKIVGIIIAVAAAIAGICVLVKKLAAKKQEALAEHPEEEELLSENVEEAKEEFSAEVVD